MRDARESIGVKRMTGQVPVSHELLLDSGAHRCDGSCPPPWTPPAVSVRRGLVSRLRNAWWIIGRLPGYRLAHKDDIAGWGEE